MSKTLEIMQYIPWTLFSVLRAYAISGRRWYVALPVLVFSAFPVILNTLGYRWEHGAYEPLFGCFSTSDVPHGLSVMFVPLPFVAFAFLTFMIASRTSFILADALVVAITWVTTYKSTRSQYRHENVPSFQTLLYRNGIVYFVVLTVLNILHLVLSLLSVASNGSEEASLVVSFAEPITSILVSNFLMELQAAKRRTEHQQSLNFGTDSSSSVLDRVLGALDSNIGSSEPEPRGFKEGIEVA
ncbi:hypothetical protein C8Q74DRAFT_1368023 [Fomes fomentarius]|nr:hypothetical protein C8Q74DRAFT_1368023 [Fomes fomentarius]